MSALRIAVYDLYWSTLGGGEQVAGTIAERFATAGHDVAVLGPDRPDIVRTREHLGVDLSQCTYRPVHDDEEASDASRSYDLFVNSTYMSTAPAGAALAWYYVHFPQRPLRSRDRLRNHVAASGVRFLGSGQLPPPLDRARGGFERRVRRTGFLATYSRFIANSRFTAGWTERLWNVSADVVYPPVRPAAPELEKQPSILNLGRFFDPTHGHSKRQLELIDAFDRLGLEGWRLSLAGGCDSRSREYALAARRAAQGRPIDVAPNAKGSVVQKLLAEASIYWSAGGYLADPVHHPEQFEHFGISVVEAMASGAVPIVFGAGGPAEIVEHGVNGFHWRDLEELVTATQLLVSDEIGRRTLAAAARHRAVRFSTDAFTARLDQMLATDTEASAC
jgi:glycosyltransferase involved in cell wall biosynthesis